MKVGLVLEGGGLRGVFTGGVLEYFLENNIHFPYVIGVSAGACNAVSYVAKQKGRNKEVTIGYIDDPRYYSYWNLIRGKELFDMDFLFDEIPNELVPLDQDTLNSVPTELVVVTTDVETGQALYIKKDETSNLNLAVRASSSLPMMADTVELDGKLLLDGGMADSIPVKQAVADGYERNVVILTREREYRKPISPTTLKIMRAVLKTRYKNYPELIETVINRNALYNKALDELEEMEARGEVLVIRPQEPVNFQRIVRDAVKLEDLYNRGYALAKEMHEKIINYIKG